MINLPETDEIISIIVYDHERNKFAVLHTNSWIDGQANKLSPTDAGRFQRKLLELVEDYFQQAHKTT